MPDAARRGPYTSGVRGDVTSVVQSLINNIDSVVRGKHLQVRQAVCCLLIEGHLLLDDAPGTGKAIVCFLFVLAGQPLAGCATMPPCFEASGRLQNTEAGRDRVRPSRSAETGGFQD